MKISAYAKVNFTLDVLGVRPDGYHELSSVVLPIELHDDIDILFLPPGAGASRSDCPYRDDLCLKAYEVLAEKVPEVASRRVDIRVKKRIPAGGGLGGGSADAAAVLRALVEIFSLGMSPEELAVIGGEVGSDVPALVLAQHYRSAVFMTGRGERVRCIASPAVPPGDLFLVNPRVHSSTAEVFRNHVVSPSTGSNALEETAVRLYPQIGSARRWLSQQGARGVRMTGSGATVFGFADFDIPGSCEYDIIRTKLLCECPVV